MITNEYKAFSRMIKAFSWGLLFAPWLVSSCSEDEGNYDYHEIPEVTISGVEDSYTVLDGAGYVLEIDPQVTTTGDPNNLEYQWKIQYYTSPDINAQHILGTERKLSWSVDESADVNSPCTLILRVTDKTSGVTVSKFASCVKTTRLGSGIMLLAENESGNAQLQFISMASDTVVIYNALNATSGFEQPLGKPVAILKAGRGSFLPMPQFWLSTEQDAWRFNANFVKTDGSELSNNLFMTDESYELGNSILVDAFPKSRRLGEPMIEFNSSNSAYVLSNGIILLGSTGFVDPANIVSGENELSLARPYLFYSSQNAFQYFLYYDYVHERFLSVDARNSLTTKLSDVEGDLFPWNNQSLNRTLQFGEPTSNTDGGSSYGNSYALMRDKSTNDYFIYKFYKNGSTNVKMDFFSVGKVPTDLTQAKFYAFSSKRTALYYAVGSKLYGLDFNRGNEKCYLIRDFGEEITCMRRDDQIAPADDYIYLATYSEGKGGTFMKLEQGMDPDKLELKEVSGEKWTGLGKVVSWSWK